MWKYIWFALLIFEVAFTSWLIVNTVGKDISKCYNVIIFCLIIDSFVTAKFWLDEK